MFVVMSGDLRRELRALSRTADDREVCGALIGSRHDDTVIVTAVERLANVSDLPDAFECDAAAIVALDAELSEKGLEIVGFWHTHRSKDASPSTHDAAGAWPGAVTAIVCNDRSPAVRFWRFENESAVELSATGTEACKAALTDQNRRQRQRP